MIWLDKRNLENRFSKSKTDCQIISKGDRVSSSLLNITLLELEIRLKEKESKINQLTAYIDGSSSNADSVIIRQEVLAMSSSAEDDLNHDPDEEPFKPAIKEMTKQEFLMAQVDLDIIESHGSMEMSTNKMKLNNFKQPSGAHLH